jgi:hypothetical protein
MVEVCIIQTTCFDPGNGPKHVVWIIHTSTILVVLLTHLFPYLTNTKILVAVNKKREKLKDFKHLGTILTEDNDITTDVKKRIFMAYKTSYELKKQLN